MLRLAVLLLLLTLAAGCGGATSSSSSSSAGSSGSSLSSAPPGSSTLPGTAFPGSTSTTSTTSSNTTASSTGPQPPTIPAPTPLPAPMVNASPITTREAILVRLRPGASLAGVTPGLDLRAQQFLEPAQLYRLELGPGSDLNQACAGLAQQPSVTYAELDAPLQASGEGELLPQQWPLRNYGQENGTPGADLSALPAWWVTRGSPTVLVALLDTGVEAHPDLAGTLRADSSGQGPDDNGHGTQMAGLIAARGRLAGVAPQVQLLALKCLDSQGEGRVSGAVADIDYAISQGARVLNLSWTTRSDSQALHEALQRAQAQGLAVVAAAGNDGTDQPVYPAAWHSHSLLSVGASNRWDMRVSSSNFGAGVDVMAPGQDVLSTQLGGTYALATGTSVAAAHVSGALALLLSAHPEWDGTQACQHLLAGVDRVVALEGQCRTGGRLNVARALQLP